MQSVEILREEHDAVLLVLEQLERAVAAAERGAPVPAEIFGDILEFFTIFVDKCHHGKEEEAVFQPLGATNGSERVSRMLAEEHETGRQLSVAYAGAVETYTPGDVDSATQLAQAVQAYAQLLRLHIDEENRELFPLMERSLAHDDRQITAEFERIEREEIGEGTHERLHGMIDSLPDRIAPWIEVATSHA